MDGLTLIEVLIIIAIIGVLIAIALPIYSSSREKAHASNCISNLRNISQALRIYLQDNDSYWPSAKAAGAFFYTNKGLQSCPSFQPTPFKNAGLYPHFIPTGYAFNSQLIGPPNGAIPESDVRFSATTVSVCETNSSVIFMSGGMDPTDRKGRHHGGSNYLFCDGHIKWYLPETVGNPDDMKGNDGTRPTFDLGNIPLPTTPVP